MPQFPVAQVHIARAKAPLHSPDEANARLEHLEKSGPAPFAFRTIQAPET